MPFNIPGILATFQICIKPRSIVPHITVKDLRQLDFSAFKRAGYRAAVFDKDNCLTLPHHDNLVPQLSDAWEECRRVFGEDNVLIVSNSAGSQSDAGEIKAESVSHHLKVPVLRHNTLKPSYSCINDVRAYFASLPNTVEDKELIFVGDRIFTDIVMANRMRLNTSPSLSSSSSGLDPQAKVEAAEAEVDSLQKDPLPDGPLAIWTTSVWQRESMIFRSLEKGLVYAVERWIIKANNLQKSRGAFHLFLRPSSAPHKEKFEFLRRLWKS